MSKPIDYSRFDHIEDSDSDNDEQRTRQQQSNDMASTPTSRNNEEAVPLPPAADRPASQQSSQFSSPTSKFRNTITKKGSEPGRYVYEDIATGRKIYEWEQSLDEVTMYVDAPPGITTASQLKCIISPSRLKLGIAPSGNTTTPYYIDEATGGKVRTDSSSWYLDDGIITVVLGKVFKGETWECALTGVAKSGEGGNGTAAAAAAVDPYTKQEMMRGMMLERFQEENPGFDFRDADFNGAVPDPRTFMGGVRYD
uniref:CS domain-containing protein n=1 Tax=Corethron hystrix TaxID=216773 RepID=A0A7S1FQW0_9STRA|mmetsp:Transcript_20602/g.46733  ORF Transcript_20602/g.46733 Transcript_20602/m.46733 type:complete len:254 (+) Transcript_20602:74-835(+)